MPSQLTERSPRWRRLALVSPIGLLLAARLALGLAYGLVTPAWESYDEDGHFAYARYLAVYRRLLQPGDPEADAVWEKFQPPLYYALIAPAIAGFDLGDRFRGPERNPYLIHGDAGINYALHPDRLEGAAGSTVRAVLAARLVSVLLSTLSVIFVHGLARRVWPADRGSALAATLVYAFWPQFLFIGSMVTNDVLVTALSAAGLYAAVALAQDGFRARRTVWLGLILAAALLTKLNAFALVPVALIALLLSLRGGPARPLNWRSPRPWLALLLSAALLAAALGFLGSLTYVTAQVFQSQTVAEFLRLAQRGQVAEQSGQAFVLAALAYGFRTFVASFGWGNLDAYGWLYGLWTAGALVAAAGLLRAALQRPSAERGRAYLLAGVHALGLVAMSLALAIAQQDVFLVPGRYLLPALPAVSLLLITGWRAWLPARWRLPAWKALGVGLALIGLSLPLWIIAPAYSRPRPAPGGVAGPASVFFGDRIELLGHNEIGAAEPGGEAVVELCWRAAAPVEANHSVFLEVVGPDGQGYGRLVTYPGRGNYATSLWQVDVPFCDRYRISIGDAIPAPSAAELRVSMLAGADINGERLPARTAAGEALDAARFRLKVRPGEPVAAASQPASYRFGEALALRGFDVAAAPWPMPAVRVCLHWEALADPPADYEVFVHLRDTPVTAYANSTGQPRKGWYPTSLWQAGERVLDEHRLGVALVDTPPLALYVGVIDPATQSRLPAVDEAGNPVPNGEVLLARDLVFEFSDAASPSPAPPARAFVDRARSYLPVVIAPRVSWAPAPASCAAQAPLSAYP